MHHADYIRSLIYDAGGITKIARNIGIRPQAISKWVRFGQIPIERVPAMEMITGVPRHRLRPDRPDLFPPPATRRRTKEAA